MNPEWPRLGLIMNFIAQIIDTALNVLLLVVFIHVIMSWLIGFGILNTRNRHVAFVWQELERILEPIYSRIRQFMPNFGAIDLSPLILLFGIYAIRLLLRDFGVT